MFASSNALAYLLNKSVVALVPGCGCGGCCAFGVDNGETRQEIEN
jgi:hypothetical protein